MVKKILTKEELAKMIDHTLLKIQANDNEIKAVCYEALFFGFAAVAVHPTAIPIVKKILKNTPVKICAALSFFSGRDPLKLKLFEIKDAILNGANELDMVMSVYLIKEKKYNLLKKEFSEFVKAADGLTTKIILETSLLTDEEKIIACEIAKETGIDFIKTSTGFRGGANIKDIILIRRVVGPYMGVKAAGGIKDWDSARILIEAGVDRIGTSAGVKILETFKS
jgi:deoxyribose-phosphate aldolase